MHFGLTIEILVYRKQSNKELEQHSFINRC